VTTYLLQLLAGLHIVGAAVFVGSNVLVEVLIRRFELIPPGEAATISAKLGGDLSVLNSTALVLLGGTGFGRMVASGTIDRFNEAAFWSSSYGIAIASMIGLWATVVLTAGSLLYLRPRAVAKLPFDATRDEVTSRSEAAMRAARWMRHIGWYNLVAGILLILIGGFLRYGGFTGLAAGSDGPAAAVAAACYIAGGECGT